MKTNNKIAEIASLILIVLIIVAAIFLSIYNRQYAGKSGFLNEAEIDSLTTDQENLLDQFFMETIKKLDAAGGLSQTSSQNVIIGQNNDKTTEIEDLKTIDLKNNLNSDQYAKATVGRRNDLFYLRIEAALPDLITGYRYSGWLIRPDQSKEINIGELKNSETGGYALEFLSSVDYGQYKQVKVTIQPLENDLSTSTQVFFGEF